MGTEIKYLCKDHGKYEDCEGEIFISKEVYKLMAEKGESLPERCENCKKNHRSGKRETRQNYFQQTMNVALGNVAKSDFLASGFTPHNERKRSEYFIEPDSSDMQIRITDDHIRELYEKLYENQVVILASPTGTGKSVYVLYRLLQAPTNYDGDFVKMLIHQGQVIQTQPLTYATASIPETVSKKELGESAVRPMGMLGIRHRGREDYSRHNLGVVVTDGSLKNWIRDGHLGQYSLIMVDEAHKRSVNIDNLLTLLKYKLPLYPHLKVIIASATINLEEFKKAFESNGISTGVLDLSLTLEEKINYRVHYWKSKAVKDCDCWMCKNEMMRERLWKMKDTPPEEAELPEAVSSFVLEILKNTEKGGILAFLTGEAVIEKTSEILKEKIKRIPELKKVPVLPIYSRLGEEEVEKRFNHNPGDKRVLLTTDIAETSHTLKDILYVVESGYIKQFQWDPQDMTSTLPTIRHSQAGCRQRFGRVGRTQKGYVYCLYPKEEFENKFKMQTTPEIFRSPVDETVLTAKAAGISQELKFIGKPDDQKKFNAEMKRALTTVEDEGYTDEIGNITDDGLDIFRIPLAPQNKALLDLADEQNCLVEMMTFLSMTETDKSDLRTGAEAFNITNGLLVWDPRWTAATKFNVWRMHSALKAGCSDDLDFVLKLASCYLDAKIKGNEKKWTEQNFLNHQAFENISKAQKELMEIFLSKSEDKQMRELDIVLGNKIRLILTNVLKGRIVKIEVREGRLVYKFQEEDGAYGIIPEACAGEWQEGESAVLKNATQKKAVFDGQQKLISCAGSLVKIESPTQPMKKEWFFDQNIFVGSKVSVAGSGENAYVENVLQAPSQINIEYGEKLDFSMLMDDYLRPGYKPLITFSYEDAMEKFKEVKGKIKAIWQDKRTAKEAKVIGWRRGDDSLCAMVAPFDERDVLQGIKDQKKATVMIEKVFKEVHDAKGWVLAKTEEGVGFPIESNDLSLSFLNYGLISLEDKWLELPVKKISMRGMPVLSNVSNIIAELDSIKEKIIKEGELEFKAVTDKIDPIKNLITVFVMNESGSIYAFSIRLRSIPKTLKIGDDITVAVDLKEGRSFITRILEDYEIESLPPRDGWGYDAESERLFFPYFLDEKELKDFEVEEEFKEKIVKNSWTYGFTARIVSR